MLVKDCNFKYVERCYWPWVGSVIISSNLPWWRPSVCVVLFQGPTFIFLLYDVQRYWRFFIAQPLIDFFRFVWLGLFVQLENFSLIWIHSYCRWRDVIFYLCSKLMAILSLRVLRRVTLSVTRGIRLQW